MLKLFSKNLVFKNIQRSITEKWFNNFAFFLESNLQNIRLPMPSVYLFERNSFRSAVRSLGTLLPVLGVTWLFGILAVNEKAEMFQFIFVIANSLQVCPMLKKIIKLFCYVFFGNYISINNNINSTF